jgi:Spy/CpxP family protein refolding chaperone
MAATAGKGMGMMSEMGGMMQGMMGGKGEMGGMAPSGMAAPAKAMGMCCMGEMGMPPGGSAGMSSAAPAPGMAGMSGPSSAMPGQPGASHLLHMGSTGFFLNHSQHITLTADQKSKLNRIKEKSMLDQASEQRKIDQGEQELYTLTGADQLDNSKVQGKIAEIEKLRTGQRMNFIQAVGEASNVLTHDQHLALMGTMPDSKK